MLLRRTLALRDLDPLPHPTGVISARSPLCGANTQWYLVRCTRGRGTSAARLRCEIWREIAPYVGYEWQRLLDDTANFERQAGGQVTGERLVAGVRFRF